MKPPTKCPVCGTRLSKWLVDSGYSMHINCDPGNEQPWDWKRNLPTQDVIPTL